METLPRNNFLIVENDAADAFLIKRALSAAGCNSSFVCRNPSEARAYLKGAGMYADRQHYPFPDVMITDLQMGQESGIELVKWMRLQEDSIKRCKVVILTGSASDLQLDAAEKVGAERVFRKPVRLEDLQEMLAKLAEEFCPRVS